MPMPFTGPDLSGPSPVSESRIVLDWPAAAGLGKPLAVRLDADGAVPLPEDGFFAARAALHGALCVGQCCR